MPTFFGLAPITLTPPTSTQLGTLKKHLLDDWMNSHGPRNKPSDSIYAKCCNYFAFISSFPWKLDPRAHAGCLCSEQRRAGCSTGCWLSSLGLRPLLSYFQMVPLGTILTLFVTLFVFLWKNGLSPYVIEVFWAFTVTVCVKHLAQRLGSPQSLLAHISCCRDSVSVGGSRRFLTHCKSRCSKQSIVPTCDGVSETALTHLLGLSVLAQLRRLHVSAALSTRRAPFSPLVQLCRAPLHLATAAHRGSSALHPSLSVELDSIGWLL